ncbi:FtsK/SpoIIIE domain-containing protein [Rhizohabitans arisaemae]|uniref:FtsK/SpoIIIE domain-containing protein n=1 Tax=Rhizohabitans arisaemae TaxID=2720610 RepID=UPI0024B16D22|nr:FtsK/SpoIIIE domain-containing protein [Rhizohabitans arisaemae]
MLRKLPGDYTKDLVSTTPTSVVFQPTVVKTPRWLTVLSLVWRACSGLVGSMLAHPIVWGLAVALAVLVWYTGWLASLLLVVAVVAGLLVWRRLDRGRFDRWIGWRLLGFWRWLWVYRRHWQPVMVVSGLAARIGGREYLPTLVKVRCTPVADVVMVKMLHGQPLSAWAERSEHLAHGFSAKYCRVRSVKPGTAVLTLPHTDLLASVVPALPIPEQVNLKAVAVGRCDDGQTLKLKVHGTHVLIVGATGAGKGSWLWSTIRGMLPAIRDDLVQVWALDPKLMELSYGRRLFHRYASSPEDCAELLENAVEVMQARAERMAGKVRDHTPTPESPFLLVIVDEVAFLTAYQQDKGLKARVNATLATLTTQGRAVGVGVMAALQDPRKDVISIRNLFPDKIALRLDESEQVDMVLGDGARDRGALADQISPRPQIGAGVGYLRLETDPEPVRARAAYVTDADIRQMEAEYGIPGETA